MIMRRHSFNLSAPRSSLLARTCLIVLSLSSGLMAVQDPAQLQKLYDETLQQLQQSQDRKNQLANENTKLSERVAELEKELRATQLAASRTEFMQNQYAAFRSFMGRYPALLEHFKQFVGRSADGSTTLSIQPVEFYDREWPFSAAAALNEGL